MKKLSSIASFVILLGLSSQVSASLMLDVYGSDSPTPTTIGGYSMTDFAFLNSTAPTSSIAAPGGGTLDFSTTLNGSTADANPTATNGSGAWWVNGENNVNPSINYDIYTTHVNLVTLTLPENTLAFSFNVGAKTTSMSQNAWLTATETVGTGIGYTPFNVNSANTPGFGIYANSSDSCSYITSVTIDPDYWGFGNFSISTGDCSTEVPEPSIITLFGLGLLGLGFARRRKHN